MILTLNQPMASLHRFYRKLISKSATKTFHLCRKQVPFSSSTCMFRMSCQLRWVDLEIKAKEVRPSFSLNTGQCFNWKCISKSNDNLWLGMIDEIPLVIQQLEHTTQFALLEVSEINSIVSQSSSSASYRGKSNSIEMKHRLYQYFQLEHSLEDLYTSWSTNCPRIAVIAQYLPGVRVIQQDPWECLISFICSTNNNISRITQMLDKLRYHYGDYVCSVKVENHSVNTDNMDMKGEVDTTDSSVKIKSEICDNETNLEVYMDDSRMCTKCDNNTSENISQEFINNRPLWTSVTPNNVDSFTVYHMYTFPSPDALATSSEEDLRRLGMGYRAKYIIKTAQMVGAKEGGGREWLKSLRYSQLVDVKNEDNGVVAIKQECVESNVDTLLTSDKPTKRRKIKIESTTSSTASSIIDTSVRDSDDIKIKTELSSITVPHMTATLQHRQKVIDYLLEFPGVGPKVADCIALFSLNQCSTVPVDTHVWNIAARDYAPELLLTKSLMPTVYESIGRAFCDRFGDKAGWAHSVLFAAELPEFRKLLPIEMQEEMRVFAINQKELKKEKKIESDRNKVRKKVVAMVKRVAV